MFKCTIFVALILPDDLFVKWFVIDDYHLVTSVCEFQPDRISEKGYLVKYIAQSTTFLIFGAAVGGFII